MTVLTEESSTKRQWNAVKRIFMAAANLDRRQRGPFLKRKCADKAVLRQVRSLLAQHDQDDQFLSLYSSVGVGALAHFEIHERLGEGGMAVVYKARDTQLQRWVALKLLHPWVTAKIGSQEPLMQEARRASALNHPNIVTIHNVIEQNGLCFIVMEYLPGERLDRLIPRSGFSLTKAMNYATQIVGALAAAHAAGIVHGDLKPSNVMATRGDLVKLLDFGLAKALIGRREAPQSPQSPRFATKAYMAPELLEDRRRAAGPVSEVFSLGLLLQEMLTGRHAFGRGSSDELSWRIQNASPRALPARIHPAVAAIIARCLERRPARRFQSMQRVLGALKKCPLAIGAPETPRSSSIATSKNSRVRPSNGSGLLVGDSRRIRNLIGEIGYQDIAKSRSALLELQELISQGIAAPARRLVVSALKDVVTTIPEFTGGPVPGGVREMRRAAVELLKAVTHGNLRSCLAERDLKFLDLYGMNFAGQDLSAFSFRGCFLVEASFKNAGLPGACFAEARLSNVNFFGAKLTNVDLTDADWFNTLGLTERQLRAVRPETLLACPPTLEAMHLYLSAHYVFPFDSWTTVVQERLIAAWDEYLRPGGLRDFVANRVRRA